MRQVLSRMGLVYIVYFALVMLLRWQWSLDLVGWWIGGALGMEFVFIDRLVHVYLTRPQDQLSVQVRDLIRKGSYKEALMLLFQRREEQQYLVVRSVFFMAAWVPMALFVITSTGSMLGTGLVMGIGLHLLYDSLVDFKNIERLKWWLFWSVKRKVSDKEAKVVVWVFAGVFGLLSLLLV